MVDGQQRGKGGWSRRMRRATGDDAREAFHIGLQATRRTSDSVLSVLENYCRVGAGEYMI